MEDPLMSGGPPYDGGPPDDGGPPYDRGPLMMAGHPLRWMTSYIPWKMRTTMSPKTSLDW